MVRPLENTDSYRGSEGVKSVAKKNRYECLTMIKTYLPAKVWHYARLPPFVEVPAWRTRGRTSRRKL